MTDSKWQPVESDPFIAGESSAQASTPVQAEPDKPLHSFSHYMGKLQPRVKLAPVVPDAKPPSLPSELFERSWQLMKNNGYIKGHYAVNAQGRDVEPASEDAVKWCVLGSWMATCEHEPDSDYMFKYMSTVWNMANPGAMVSTRNGMPYEINDRPDTTIEKIGKLFNRTINFLLENPEFNNPFRK